MNGKRIKLDDYTFTFGQQDVFLNVYGAFSHNKRGNKYVVYSYDNGKLCYGSLFIRENKIVVMTSDKEANDDIIKKYINNILEEKETKEFTNIAIDDIKEMQIIDEKEIKMDIDLNKLSDLTIPKPKAKEETDVETKKGFSLAYLGIFILLVFIGVFFFINPEIIKGKNTYYECSKSYLHDELPATVNEIVSLTFNSKGIVDDMKIKSDFVFNDTTYYVEFRDKSYFYKYIEEGDTYKFDDSSYTYRLFSEIDVHKDYFLPTEKEELLSYYQDKGYNCKQTGDE